MSEKSVEDTPQALFLFRKYTFFQLNKSNRRKEKKRDTMNREVAPRCQGASTTRGVNPSGKKKGKSQNNGRKKKGASAERKREEPQLLPALGPFPANV